MGKGKRKLKILFFSHSSKLSGGERSLLDIFRNINRSTYDPTLVTPIDGPLVEVAGSLDIPWVQLDVSNELLKRRRRNIRPFSRVFFRDAVTTTVAAAKLDRIIRESDIDLVHSNSMKAHFISAIAAHRSGTPLISHVRDILEDRNARVITDLFLGTFADRIIAVSEAVAEQFKIAAPRVKLVYNGINVEELSADVAACNRKAALKSLGLPTAAKTVVNIGQLSRWKGQSIFIRAAKEILKRVPDTHFLIVGGPIFGETDYVKFLEQLASDLGMKERVHFVGEREGVVEVLTVADLLLHTPIKPEPFGRVIVEAMAADVPVVATRCGGIPEIIEDGGSGVLVETNNVMAAANAVCDLLMDEKRARRVSRAGRRRAMDFDIGVTVSSIEGLYGEYMLPGKTEYREYTPDYAFSTDDYYV